MSTADLIYEAALHPEGWPDALKSIAGETGAREVAIASYNMVTTVYETISLPIGRHSNGLNSYYCATRNFLWERTARLKIGQVFSFDTVLPGEQPSRAAFYTDWWHPQRLDRAIGMKLIADDEVSAVITLHRPNTRPDFSTRDRRKFASLLPHLVRALEIRRCLAHSDSVATDFYDILASLDKAGFVVDGAGRLLHCNLLGEQLLADKAFTLSGSGILTAGNHADTSALLRLTNAATGLGAKSGRTSISRADRRALLTRVCPLPGTGSVYTQPRALILCDDPDIAINSVDHATLLRIEHNLTASEAAIAIQVSSGETLKDYANRTGIAYATARTHLARIFDKMGVHRQSELSRLIIKSGLDG
jgi:DNA-binding CsgD family transcriptional regulator